MARVLVRDENEADDLEQEMWLEALERPPRSERSLKGWFATALRHDLVDRRRSSAGRDRYEKSRARSEAIPPAADVVAEADAHKRVVVAVMDLPEPYRSTVLFRFFEDIPPSVIAARAGVPLETVRTRLRRALALLRTRFDEESGGGRNEWCLALLPLVRSPLAAAAPTGTATTAVVGGLVMKSSIQAAVAAGLLTTCGLAWWALSASASAPVEVAQQAAPAPARPLVRMARAPRAAPPAPESPPVTQAMQAPAPPPAAALQAMVQAAPPAPPAAAPPQPAAPVGEVAGRVLLLGDRSPVEGATVTLRDASPAKDGVKPAEIQPLTTGATGQFRFRGVPVGTYVLHASKEGLAERTMPGVTLTDSGGVEGLEVLLAAGGAIAGLVTDAQGAPVAGLSVTTQWDGPPIGSAATTTGDDGTFRFERLVAGRHHVVLKRAPDKEQSTYVTVVDGETARADFAATAALTGVVLDERGAAVAGATVRASSSQSGKYVSERAKTDEAGRFRVEGLTEGEWTVSVQTSGDDAFAADLATVTVASGDQDVALRLAAGAIAGRVFVKATGEAVGVRAAQISLYSLVQGPGGAWRMGPSAGMAFGNKDGTFRFRGVAPGRYRLVVTPQDKSLHAFEKDIDVASTAVEGVEVALEGSRNGTVRIVVKDPDGKPVEGVSLTTVTDEPGGGSSATSLHASVESPGVYLAPVEAGHRKICVFREDFQPTDVTLEVVEGQTAQVDVVLRWIGGDVKGAGEIGGRLLVRGTRKPLTQKEVGLTLYAVSPWKFVSIATAGADGQFRFLHVPPGTYRIMASPVKPVYRPAQADVVLTAGGGNKDGIEIALDPCSCGKVKFVVRDAAGKPVEGANFSTVREEGGGRSTSTGFAAESTEPGVYFAELETGSWVVNVYREGFDAGVATVAVKKSGTVEVKVVLRPKADTR
jgi:RNA polymerase sigma factor (sigma-70 family)